MARHRLRSQDEVAQRCETLRGETLGALERADRGDREAAVVDGIWQGEALGTLLWALDLTELPPYDQPFDTVAVVAVELDAGALRPPEEVELERDTARLWHWRARTSELQATGGVELPPRYSTFDQLIAATAMRGHEHGLLPEPTRGDFQAYGKVYRHLAVGERDEAHSIALERHRALNWLCGLGETWADVPLDT